MANFNFIDDVISFISPAAGAKRARARFMEDQIRKYDAASAGRRVDDWKANDTSQNTETKNSLELLRSRSRDMVRNNTYAKTAIDVICTNVIGGGIRLTINDDATKDKTTVEWNAWADSTYCDFNGKLNFYGIQELVMRSVAESGECLILRKRVSSKEANGRIPLQLQVLEADYLYPFNDTLDGVSLTESKIKPATGNTIIQGIEFDSRGKRVAYWLYTQHPGDYQGMKDLEPKRVLAKDVIHIFQSLRPGQVRGVPFGASALLQLKDLQDFQDAELVRQKIASCFAVFITEPTGDPVNATGTKDKKQKRERVEPGIIQHLAPGKEVTFTNPPANTGYAEYTKRILQSIATGFGITYEALTSDLSMVNFSSGRMGWLEFYRRIQSWQFNIIIPTLCEGTYEWFLEAGDLSGKIKQKSSAEWTPPRREMIDPVKETKGIKMAIRAGLMTWQEAVRREGYDPKNQLKQLAEDAKSFDANKLVLDIDARQDLAPKKDITEN